MSNDTRNAIRHLLSTSWFPWTVIACELLVFTLGISLGVKIGFAKGKQVAEVQVQAHVR
jgi:hypothetical protein